MTGSGAFNSADVGRPFGRHCGEIRVGETRTAERKRKPARAAGTPKRECPEAGCPGQRDAAEDAEEDGGKGGEFLDRLGERLLLGQKTKGGKVSPGYSSIVGVRHCVFCTRIGQFAGAYGVSSEFLNLGRHGLLSNLVRREVEFSLVVVEVLGLPQDATLRLTTSLPKLA
jgi:hypothetical protein